MSTLTYLCCPYSHPDPDVRERRFRAVNRVAASLIVQGKIVFSPVSHSHPIALVCEDLDALDHGIWLTQDLAFLEFAKEVLVLMLDGWRDSAGIKREIARAEALGIPVEYIGPALGEREEAK